MQRAEIFVVVFCCAKDIASIFADMINEMRTANEKKETNERSIERKIIIKHSERKVEREREGGIRIVGTQVVTILAYMPEHIDIVFVFSCNIFFIFFFSFLFLFINETG